MIRGSGIGKRHVILIAIIATVIVASPGIDVVVGIGDSMEPRYQSCDLLLVDTIRDTAHAVTINDVIAYESGSGLIVHEVVGVAAGQDYVWAKGQNQGDRDRVTSEMLVGVVVAHLDTSEICSIDGLSLDSLLAFG